MCPTTVDDECSRECRTRGGGIGMEVAKTMMTSVRVGDLDVTDASLQEVSTGWTGYRLDDESWANARRWGDFG